MLPSRKTTWWIVVLLAASAVIVVLAPGIGFFAATPATEYREPTTSPAAALEEAVDLTLVPPGAPHVDERQVAGTADDVQEDAVRPRRCLVEVSVRDAGSGAPISGAVVSCDGEVIAETSDAGRAAFEADSGRWLTVRATATGRCPGVDRVQAEEDGTSVEASITLVPAAAIHGVVRGPDGSPARYAEVVLYLLSPGLVRPVAAGVDGLASGASVRADAEGAFRFDGIGSHRGLWRAKVVVLHEGCARFEGETFEVRNGQEIGPVVCNLDDGAQIRGRVTVRGAGASATVFLAGVGQPVETAVEGAYKLDHVPPGSVTVGVALVANPWVRASIPLEVEAGEERVLDFSLDYDLRVFSGVVTTPEGVPLDGVRVWCETQEFHELEPVRYFGRTGLNGAYRIEAPVRIGETGLVYTLRLGRWEDDCAVVAEPDQERVNLACAGSAVVEVTVADSADDRPLMAFDPVWFPADAPGTDRVLLDYQNPLAGQLVTVVPAGSGELQVSLPGYHPLRVPLTTHPGDRLDLGRVQLDAVR